MSIELNNWAKGKSFPLVDDVCIDTRAKDVVGAYALDHSATKILPQGTVVVFDRVEQHWEIRQCVYYLHVLEDGYSFKVTEDGLVDMDINPLWD